MNNNFLYGEKNAGVYKTEGIILKKAGLSDSGRLLTIYTKKLGKILVRAKGIGKKESKLKTLIEPFNLYEFMLAKGRNIDVLANVWPQKEFIYLRSNLENLSLAIYFAELVDKLIVAPEPDEKIWMLLLRAMEALNQKRDNLPKIKEAFEDRLLSFLGHPSLRQAQGKLGKSTEREKSHYLQSLAGEEIKSVNFLRSLNLIS